MSLPDIVALAALAERLGYHLDDAQIADVRAAVEAGEPAAARLRADAPLDDGWPMDPAHGDAWLRGR
ncbi:hypothetical protein [Pseudonocardia sp. N23]|uniref:hypothetical protein n=1 Tax=Pseudonocardia sp. N23 TaxID=1987376 RepID=UPI000BFE13CC|nr:hypothetical protein [Pseudonocardia sp. N23]GAY08838.1 hypothetical protein TOK_2794 [Pseudonocardia sp. N23]